MNEPVLFRSVDHAVFVTALAEKLRVAGVPVSVGATGRCCDALLACPPTSTSALYWVTRTCLVHDHRLTQRFDEVFAAVFDAEGLPIAPWERDRPRTTATMRGTVLRHSGPVDGLAEAQGRVSTGNTPEIVDAGESDADPDDKAIPEIVPSALAHLSDVPFDQLSNDDLAAIGAWLEQKLVTFPLRTTRRRQRWAHGSVDLRRTLSSARSTYGEPMHLARRRPVKRPRPVVMVADVSGSMESFARIYLHLMRALVVAGDAEVFTFTTELRRVTVALRDGDPQAAIDRLSDDVADRFGGTRIATSIGALTRSPAWSNRVRGASVVVASDGWDTDNPADLAAEMRRLERMAHRVIWINPRAAATNYEPLTGGMAAALPHVDALLSGHSLRAMHDLIDALASDGHPARTRPTPLRAVRSIAT